MKIFLDTFSASLIAISFVTVLITVHLSGYEDFLTVMTRENGFFEWMSVIILITIFIYGTVFCWKNHRTLSWLMLALIGGFSFVAFMGAMEKISWGQQLLDFESPDYFLAYNYQQETNLHNFMPADLFSAIIFAFIYGIFVFIPLLVTLLAPHIKHLNLLLPWMATPSMVLIILYGSSFQRYFLDSLTVRLDMIILLCGMILFGIVAAFKKMSLNLIVFYLFAWISIGLFMHSHEYFGYFINLANEIREVFTGLALLYYFIFLTQKYKGCKTQLENRQTDGAI